MRLHCAGGSFGRRVVTGLIVAAVILYGARGAAAQTAERSSESPAPVYQPGPSIAEPPPPAPTGSGTSVGGTQARQAEQYRQPGSYTPGPAIATPPPQPGPYILPGTTTTPQGDPADGEDVSGDADGEEGDSGRKRRRRSGGDRDSATTSPTQPRRPASDVARENRQDSASRAKGLLQEQSGTSLSISRESRPDNSIILTDVGALIKDLDELAESEDPSQFALFDDAPDIPVLEDPDLEELAEEAADHKAQTDADAAASDAVNRKPEIELAENDRQLSEEEIDRRKKIPGRAEQAERETNLDDRQDAIDQKQSGLEEEADKLNKSRYQQETKNKELVSDIEKAKRGWPGPPPEKPDPNCRGPRCSGLKSDLGDNRAELNRTNRDLSRNQQAQEKLGIDQRNVDRERREIAEARDNGVGLTRQEHYNRLANKEINRLQGNVDDLRRKKAELESAGKTVPGSLERELAQAEKEQGQFAEKHAARRAGELADTQKQIDKLEGIVSTKRTPAENARLMRLKTNRSGLEDEIGEAKAVAEHAEARSAGRTSLAGGEPRMRVHGDAGGLSGDARLSNRDLAEKHNRLSDALDRYDKAKDQIGRGGKQAEITDSAEMHLNRSRNEYAQARQALEDAAARVDNYSKQHAVNQQKVDAARAELDRNPTGENREKLQQAENALNRSGREWRSAFRDQRRAEHAARGAANELNLAEVEATAESASNFVSEYNSSFGDTIDSRGRIRPKALASAIQSFEDGAQTVIRREQRLDGLVGQRGALEGRVGQALAAGADEKDPGIARAGRKIEDLNVRIDHAQEQQISSIQRLRGAGHEVDFKDDGRTVISTKNPLVNNHLSRHSESGQTEYSTAGSRPGRVQPAGAAPVAAPAAPASLADPGPSTASGDAAPAAAGVGSTVVRKQPVQTPERAPRDEGRSPAKPPPAPVEDGGGMVVAGGSGSSSGTARSALERAVGPYAGTPGDRAASAAPDDAKPDPDKKSQDPKTEDAKPKRERKAETRTRKPQSGETRTRETGPTEEPVRVSDVMYGGKKPPPAAPPPEKPVSEWTDADYVRDARRRQAERDRQLWREAGRETEEIEETGPGEAGTAPGPETAAEAEEQPDAKEPDQGETAEGRDRTAERTRETGPTEEPVLVSDVLYGGKEPPPAAPPPEKPVSEWTDADYVRDARRRQAERDRRLLREFDGEMRLVTPNAKARMAETEVSGKTAPGEETAEAKNAEADRTEPEAETTEKTESTESAETIEVSETGADSPEAEKEEDPAAKRADPQTVGTQAAKAAPQESPEELAAEATAAEPGTESAAVAEAAEAEDPDAAPQLSPEELAAAREEQRQQDAEAVEQLGRQSAEAEKQALAEQEQKAFRELQSKRAAAEKELKALDNRIKEALRRGDRREAFRLGVKHDELMDSTMHLFELTGAEAAAIERRQGVRDRLVDEISNKARVQVTKEMETSEMLEDAKDLAKAAGSYVSTGAEMQNEMKKAVRAANREKAFAEAKQKLILQKMADPNTTAEERQMLKGMLSMANLQKQGAEDMIESADAIAAVGYTADVVTTVGTGGGVALVKAGVKGGAKVAGKTVAVVASKELGETTTRKIVEKTTQSGLTDLARDGAALAGEQVGKRVARATAEDVTARKMAEGMSEAAAREVGERAGSMAGKKATAEFVENTTTSAGVKKLASGVAETVGETAVNAARAVGGEAGEEALKSGAKKVTDAAAWTAEKTGAAGARVAEAAGRAAETKVGAAAVKTAQTVGTGARKTAEVLLTDVKDVPGMLSKTGKTAGGKTAGELGKAAARQEGKSVIAAGDGAVASPAPGSPAASPAASSTAPATRVNAGKGPTPNLDLYRRQQRLARNAPESPPPASASTGSGTGAGSLAAPPPAGATASAPGSAAPTPRVNAGKGPTPNLDLYRRQQRLARNAPDTVPAAAPPAGAVKGPGQRKIATPDATAETVPLDRPGGIRKPAPDAEKLDVGIADDVDLDDMLPPGAEAKYPRPDGFTEGMSPAEVDELFKPGKNLTSDQIDAKVDILSGRGADIPPPRPSDLPRIHELPDGHPLKPDATEIEFWQKQVEKMVSEAEQRASRQAGTASRPPPGFEESGITRVDMKVPDPGTGSVKPPPGFDEGAATSVDLKVPDTRVFPKSEMPGDKVLGPNDTQVFKPAEMPGLSREAANEAASKSAREAHESLDTIAKYDLDAAPEAGGINKAGLAGESPPPAQVRTSMPGDADPAANSLSGGLARPGPAGSLEGARRGVPLDAGRRNQDRLGELRSPRIGQRDPSAARVKGTDPAIDKTLPRHAVDEIEPKFLSTPAQAEARLKQWEAMTPGERMDYMDAVIDFMREAALNGDRWAKRYMNDFRAGKLDLSWEPRLASNIHGLNSSGKMRLNPFDAKGNLRPPHELGAVALHEGVHSGIGGKTALNEARAHFVQYAALHRYMQRHPDAQLSPLIRSQYDAFLSGLQAGRGGFGARSGIKREFTDGFYGQNYEDMQLIAKTSSWKGGNAQKIQSDFSAAYDRLSPENKAAFRQQFESLRQQGRHADAVREAERIMQQDQPARQAEVRQEHLNALIRELEADIDRQLHNESIDTMLKDLDEAIGDRW